MASFKARVEQYVGPADHSLNSLLTQSARSLVDLIPTPRAEQYTVEKTDDGDGVPLEGVRFISAYKDGRAAILKPAGKQAAIQDSDSIHYATDFSPAAVVTAGKAFVYPDGGKVHVIPYPTVKEDQESIDNFPEGFDSLVVISAAKQRVVSKMNQRSVDEDDIELSGPLANLLGRLDAERQNLLQTLFPQTQQGGQQ